MLHVATDYKQFVCCYTGVVFGFVVVLLLGGSRRRTPLIEPLHGSQVVVVVETW